MHYHHSCILLFSIDCDSHDFFCRLQSNVFAATSLVQTNCMVHWNAPSEDIIFFCVASWHFLLHDVHWQHVDLQGESSLAVVRLKVIPLKLFYYQTFFETWCNEHSWYEHYKNAKKIWGHRACLRVSRLLKWGIFTGCALNVWITFIQN